MVISWGAYNFSDLQPAREGDAFLHIAPDGLVARLLAIYTKIAALHTTVNSSNYTAHFEVQVITASCHCGVIWNSNLQVQILAMKILTGSSLNLKIVSRFRSEWEAVHGASGGKDEPQQLFVVMLVKVAREMDLRNNLKVPPFRTLMSG